MPGDVADMFLRGIHSGILFRSMTVGGDMSAEFDDLSRFAVPCFEQVSSFMQSLETARGQRSTADWREFVRASHVLRQWRYFLTIDPYTRWGLLKPRGYAGDATLMDFAYRHASIDQYVSSSGELGQSIYRLTSGAPQSQSARDRILMMRGELIEASRRGPASIVSLASGHARELEDLSSIEADFDRITFLDSDPISLAVATSVVVDRQPTAHRCNVVKNPLPDLPKADVVYAMGLFDYLTDPYATDVIRKMSGLVAPEGVCVIGNLDPGAANLGYCEAMMDWWMVVRSPDDLVALANSALGQERTDFSCEVSQLGCFNYLRLRRL